jgi:hypothetical protein
LLSQKDAPPFEPLLEQTSKRVARHGPVGRCADRPELVTCAMAHETDDQQPAYDLAVERKNCDEISVSIPARDNDGLLSKAEVAPPR